MDSVETTPASATSSLELDDEPSWTAKQIATFHGLSVMTVRRRSADPNDDFPKMVRLGPGAVRGIPSEHRRYRASRPRVTKGGRAA